MANKVNKSFWVYILLLLGVCAGACVIMAAIMVLSPGLSIFGIRYCINNQVLTTDFVSLDGCNNIEISSTNYTIVIDSQEDLIYENKIAVKLYSTGSGFCRVDDYAASKLLGPTKENGTLKIGSIEPKMLLSLGGINKLVILLPRRNQSILQNKNVTISSTSGAISLGVDGDTNGSTNKYSFNNLTVKTNNSSIVLGKYLTLGGNKVNIEGDNYNLTCSANLSNSVSFGLYSEGKLKATFNSDIKDLEIKGNFTEIYAKNITGRLSYVSSGGYIKANKVGSVGFDDNQHVNDSNIAHINIDEVAGSCLISNAKSSKVNLGTVNGTTIISMDNGSVNINNAKGRVDIKTESGNVKMSTSYTSTSQTNASSITTNSGNINVTFINNPGKYFYIDQYNKGGIQLNIKENTKFKVSYFTNNKIDISWLNNNAYTSKKGVEDTITVAQATDADSHIYLNTNRSGHLDGAYAGLIKLSRV